MEIRENIEKLRKQIPEYVTLVAVSKTKSVESILEAYNAGQRVFGENKVQELVTKYESLPKDIKWHMIGHLQTNKVKYIAPFVDLIHSIDSIKLLKEVNRVSTYINRVLNCLIQIYIAKEDTKFGFTFDQAEQVLNSKEYKQLRNVRIVGVMGMATNTEDAKVLKSEFQLLSQFFQKISTNNSDLRIMSMGMSSDYRIAIEEGSTMIRVGSSIFGDRN